MADHIDLDRLRKIAGLSIKVNGKAMNPRTAVKFLNHKINNAEKYGFKPDDLVRFASQKQRIIDAVARSRAAATAPGAPGRIKITREQANAASPWKPITDVPLDSVRVPSFREAVFPTGKGLLNNATVGLGYRLPAAAINKALNAHADFKNAYQIAHREKLLGDINKYNELLKAPTGTAGSGVIRAAHQDANAARATLLGPNAPKDRANFNLAGKIVAPLLAGGAVAAPTALMYPAMSAVVGDAIDTRQRNNQLMQRQHADAEEQLRRLTKLTDQAKDARSDNNWIARGWNYITGDRPQPLKLNSIPDFDAEKLREKIRQEEAAKLKAAPAAPAPAAPAVKTSPAIGPGMPRQTLYI